MIKHIVFWKLKPGAHGIPKEACANQIKKILEDLNGKIPGMLKLEVGFDFSKEESSSDIVLYSEFENREALEGYHVHPLHEAVKEYIKDARSERRVVDYEI